MADNVHYPASRDSPSAITFHILIKYEMANRSVVIAHLLQSVIGEEFGTLYGSHDGAYTGQYAGLIYDGRMEW